MENKIKITMNNNKEYYIEEDWDYFKRFLYKCQKDKVSFLEIHKSNSDIPIINKFIPTTSGDYIENNYERRALLKIEDIKTIEEI